MKPLPPQQGVKKVRVTSKQLVHLHYDSTPSYPLLPVDAQFYKSNPAATHRLVPWLTREFKVILGEENVSFMVALVNSMLNKLVICVCW